MENVIYQESPLAAYLEGAHTMFLNTGYCDSISIIGC